MNKRRVENPNTLRRIIILFLFGIILVNYGGVTSAAAEKDTDDIEEILKESKAYREDQESKNWKEQLDGLTGQEMEDIEQYLSNKKDRSLDDEQILQEVTKNIRIKNILNGKPEAMPEQIKEFTTEELNHIEENLVEAEKLTPKEVALLQGVRDQKIRNNKKKKNEKIILYGAFFTSVIFSFLNLKEL